MECEKCKRWVHCECYGYDGVGDPRLKEFHFCYECLFEDDSEAKNEAVILVKRRKVLKVILDKEEIKQDDSSHSFLAKELSMPKKELKEVFGALQEEKILYHRPNMKANLWKVTKSARKLKTIQARYFNPNNNKVSGTQGARTGTMSSYDDEGLTDTNNGHNSDTDYSDHDLPHFTRIYASDEYVK